MRVERKLFIATPIRKQLSGSNLIFASAQLVINIEPRNNDIKDTEEFLLQTYFFLVFSSSATRLSCCSTSFKAALSCALTSASDSRSIPW